MILQWVLGQRPREAVLGQSAQILDFSPSPAGNAGAAPVIVVVPTQGGAGDSTERPKRLGYKDRKRKLKKQLLKIPVRPERIAVAAPIAVAPKPIALDPVYLAEFAAAIAPKGAAPLALPIDDTAEQEQRRLAERTLEQVGIELQRIRVEQAESAHLQAIEDERIRLEKEEDDIIEILLLAA